MTDQTTAPTVSKDMEDLCRELAHNVGSELAWNKLLTAIASLELDKRRLDFIQEDGKDRLWILRRSVTGPGHHIHPCDLNGFVTVRDAIDNAMSENDFTTLPV